jgi:predicted nucleic acid-binding Zn ribbon protein
MNNFCANCGNKIENGASFCEKCGAPIHLNNNRKQGVQTPAELKAWYRFLKVVYVLLFIVSVGFVCIVAFTTIPQRTLDGNLSMIKCENGKSYAPAKNSIYVYGDSLSYYDDQDARILCEYDSTNYYSLTAASYQNYTFAPAYIEPDYSSWFFYTALALLIVWTILKLIRIGVQYVVLGGKPHWAQEFKKFY